MARSDVLRQLFERLNSLKFAYAVGGSFASSVWGNPRQTNDIDIVLDLRDDRLSEFITAFESDFMLSRSEIESALEDSGEYRTFQMLHYQELFKVDVFLLGSSPFQQTEFSRRQSRELFEGLQAPCFTAEDTILRKIKWYLLGNRVSDRQWNDIVGVLTIQRDLLDFRYLEGWSQELGITELFEEAKRESQI